MFEKDGKNITATLVIISILFGTIIMAGCITNQSGINSGVDSKNGLEINPKGSSEEGSAVGLTKVWSGWFAQGTSGHVTNEVWGDMYVSPDNEGYFLISDPVNHIGRIGAAGTFNVSGNTVNASLTIYNSSGMPSGTLHIKKGIIQKDTSTGQLTFKGEYSGDDEPFTGSGFFYMGIADQYNSPSSLSNISRKWFFSESDGETRFYVDLTGAITGGNDVGGVFNGFLKVIDSNYNLYEIKNFAISKLGAPWDGKYKGLASLPNPNDLDVVVLKIDGSFGFIMRFGYRV